MELPPGQSHAAPSSLFAQSKGEEEEEEEAVQSGETYDKSFLLHIC